MEKLRQAEVNAVTAYAKAVEAFTRAGFPALAKWAAEQAEEEARHACQVSAWMGNTGVPEGEAESVLQAIVGEEIAVRAAYQAELDAGLEAVDEQFVREKLKEQTAAVTEAIGKLVQARYGVF